MNDWELIDNYCRNGSESAFETLVKRHVDFVFCAALRQVRDPSLAEDVSQAVFQLLARKAKHFRSGVVLVSWLFRTTHFIAARALRSEYRRQRRELEVANMNPQITASETDHDWERVSPVLDEALAALPDKDRAAVLLRFISGRPFSQVGAEIGVSEDAAKKRVSRALARLRQFFLQRGTTLSVATIAVLLGERVVQASPVVLATKITTAVAAGASAAASTSAGVLLKTTLRDLFWTNVKRGAAIGASVVVALLFLSVALRPLHNTAIVPAQDAPAAQTETALRSRRLTSKNSGSNESAASRTLSLLVARAEDRQPLPGARVLMDCWYGNQRERSLAASTDRYGALQIPIPTRAFDSMLVYVSAEGRVPMVMMWQGHEFNEPVVSHTLLLEAGQAAEGIVLNESGNPVSGATVSFQGPGFDRGKRDNRAFHPELSGSLTDANGRWTTAQLPGTPWLGQVNIRVTHLDFTPTSPGVSRLPGFPTNALIILSNGVSLAGRVTAADGTPIPDAMVAKQSGSAYLSTRTDAEGRFFWPHIEPGQVFVDVEAKGFETIHEFVFATNTVNECALTLKESSDQVQSTTANDPPRARLHGSVVDAETGQPIPTFQVLLGDSYGLPAGSGGEAVLHGTRLLGEGQEGKFDWPGLARRGGFQLQVEAEGYLESVSEERSEETAEREFNFKLRRGVIFAGRVMTPNGAVVDNAEVLLSGRGFGAVLQLTGRLIDPNPGFEATRTRTDSEGKFRLKLKTGARGIAVVHEQGFALVTLAGATNNPVILQPWGGIDGTLYLNGQLAPNQSISVTGFRKLDADPGVLLSFSYRTTTDDRGHFRFNQVPPGEHSVARQVGCFGSGPYLVNSDHTAQVKVEGGAVASVELRRQGRLVLGRLVFQGSPEEIQWGMSSAALQGEKKFPFALSRDGAIRADDVPPGTYTLSVNLERASIEPPGFPRPSFGSLQKQVILQPVDDESLPVDLGDLTINRAN